MSHLRGRLRPRILDIKAFGNYLYALTVEVLTLVMCITKRLGKCHCEPT
jgi:hypothetical protein